MDPIELLMELLGVRQKQPPDPARYDDEAERERMAANEEIARGTRQPSGGPPPGGFGPSGDEDLMAILNRVQQEEAVSDPMDPVTAMAGPRLGRDIAVQDLQRLEAEREARFGPAPPPTDPNQAALLDRAQAQAGPVGAIPQAESALGSILPQGPAPAPQAPAPQPAVPPVQPQQASIASPRGGPIDPQVATPPNIDLGKIFAEVMQNLRSQGPMLQATPGSRPAAPQPTGPAGPPRPGIAARASAASPPPPPFPGVFAPPRTQIGMPSANVLPPPAARTDPRAQVAPQHFQVPYQAGPGASPPPVQAQAPNRAPTQIGADFQPPQVQSSADILNLAESQRIRERGGPTNVPFDQGLPGLPSNEMPGPVSTPAAPPLRSAPKPGAIPAEVPNFSVQKPKPNSGMGTEAPADLKEALLLEALRLSQKRRNPQAAGAM